MKTIHTIALVLLSASGAYAQCSAPCSYTFSDPFPPPLALCSGTVTESAPVPVTHPSTEYAGIYDVCNSSISGCPEPPAPPCQLISFTSQNYSENMYSLGGDASWSIFKLTGSASTKQTTTSSLTVSNNLCGWCACSSADIAQTDVTTTVNVSFTPVVNVLGACAPDVYLFGWPYTATLDTFTLAYKSPAILHQPSPPPGCQTVCSN